MVRPTRWGRRCVVGGTIAGVPSGTSDDGGVRRAGFLVTTASVAVAAVTLLVIGVVAPGATRTVVLAALVITAFVLAAWRAVRARRDPTPTAGLRSLRSWAAAFSWATTVFAALSAIARPDASGSAMIAGVLAGCALVIVARLTEHRTTRDEAAEPMRDDEGALRGRREEGRR